HHHLPGRRDRTSRIIPSRFTSGAIHRQVSGEQSPSPAGANSSAAPRVRPFVINSYRSGLIQGRQILASNHQPDRPRTAGGPFDEAPCFKREHHLMHRWWRESEAPPLEAYDCYLRGFEYFMSLGYHSRVWMAEILIVKASTCSPDIRGSWRSIGSAGSSAW